ncbi:MAG: hypothetical protein K6G40_03350 [Eubacterium sp.]|nr:hypothetical protein [Eubacterium sp.]
MATKEEKEEKKRLKKEAKAAKKAAKKGGAVEGAEEDEEEGGKLGLILVTLVIFIIWLGIFALLIKLDVGGFGSSVLYPILKDVPYVNKILPTSSSTVSGDADGEYGYSSLSEAIARIKELELELDAAVEKKSELLTKISDLQAEVDRLSVYETEQAEFEELKEKFYEEVIFGDSAPDISTYIEYYESIDSENAAELYKEAVQQQATNEEVEEYAKTYAAMKPKKAAEIFESMTDNLELVAEILENMDTDAKAKILDQMDSEIAASITNLMAP